MKDSIYNGYRAGQKHVRTLLPTKLEIESMIYARTVVRKYRKLSDYEEGFIKALIEYSENAPRFLDEKMLSYIFISYDINNNMSIRTLNCKTNNNAINIANSLYTPEISIVEFARIDSELPYWTERQFDITDGEINVLDNDILIARIKQIKEKYIVESCDGTTVKFLTLQKAIAFVSIYDYMSNDEDDMPW